VPVTRDRAIIREILLRDRRWAVYALGDLAPGYFEHCEWYVSGGALALVYRGSDPPVLFLSGGGADLAGVVNEIPEASYYLHLQEAAPSVLARRFELVTKRLSRMILNPPRFKLFGDDAAVRLNSADLNALEKLYADGRERGESPDFFFPSMVERGVFFGVRDGDQLVAAAGTHLVAESEDVAAVGNVYTRVDRRGRGLASMTTAAVVSELLARRIGTIALQVLERNEPAIRVYERLGFARYCTLIEGIARPLNSTTR
jgi:ribosomal protein S18 acetylase RimI-like enzyme